MTDDPAAPIERHLRLVPASSITPRPVKWLLYPLIPRAAVTLLGGREGLGKSTMWALWAAEITQGRMTTDRAPANVLVIANEDSREHTLTPRLMAADADLDHVHFIDAATMTGSTSVVLPLDTNRLAEAIRQTAAALVVIDPLVSALDGRLDSHNDHSIRQGLDPLNHLASTTDVAILGLVHLNKGRSGDVGDRILGSRAFTAAARSVLAMAPDPEDLSGRRLLVFQSKSNLGPRSTEAIIVEVHSTTIETAEGPAEVGRATIVDRREVDTDSILLPSDDSDDLSDAARWLLDFLASVGGEASRGDVMKAAEQAGWSKDQMKRAAKPAGITVRRERKAQAGTIWCYPQSAQTAHTAQSADTPDNCAPTGDDQSARTFPPSSPTALTAPTAPSEGMLNDE